VRREDAARRPAAAVGRMSGGAAGPARGFRLERDIPQDGGDCGRDIAFVEAALTRVWARWERVIEQLGGVVPATQLRALLMIDDSGPLPPGRLAMALGISPSSAGRLCDRMSAAGLLRVLGAGSSPGITLAVTETGQRLAGWIRERRRAVLAHELESMSAAGRQALARSLSELAGHQVMPPRDAMPPGTGT
jgi:DNA-binding MarR family transcriptional regulator